MPTPPPLTSEALCAIHGFCDSPADSLVAVLRPAADTGAYSKFGNNVRGEQPAKRRQPAPYTNSAAALASLLARSFTALVVL